MACCQQECAALMGRWCAVSKGKRLNKEFEVCGLASSAPRSNLVQPAGPSRRAGTASEPVMKSIAVKVASAPVAIPGLRILTRWLPSPNTPYGWLYLELPVGNESVGCVAVSAGALPTVGCPWWGGQGRRTCVIVLRGRTPNVSVGEREGSRAGRVLKWANHLAMRFLLERIPGCIVLGKPLTDRSWEATEVATDGDRRADTSRTLLGRLCAELIASNPRMGANCE